MQIVTPTNQIYILPRSSLSSTTPFAQSYRQSFLSTTNRSWVLNHDPPSLRPSPSQNRNEKVEPEPTLILAEPEVTSCRETRPTTQRVRRSPQQLSVMVSLASAPRYLTNAILDTLGLPYSLGKLHIHEPVFCLSRQWSSGFNTIS